MQWEHSNQGTSPKKHPTGSWYASPLFYWHTRPSLWSCSKKLAAYLLIYRTLEFRGCVSSRLNLYIWPIVFASHKSMYSVKLPPNSAVAYTACRASISFKSRTHQTFPIFTLYVSALTLVFKYPFIQNYTFY